MLKEKMRKKLLSFSMLTKKFVHSNQMAVYLQLVVGLLLSLLYVFDYVKTLYECLTLRHLLCSSTCSAYIFEGNVFFS